MLTQEGKLFNLLEIPFLENNNGEDKDGADIKNAVEDSKKEI